MHNFIQPDWPAPDNIKACTTTRNSGVSEAPYASFNLATHVNDDIQHVLKNRAILKQSLNLPTEPVWLDQVHGRHVVDANHFSSNKADASFSSHTNQVCVVMTADCLPVLICNRQGTKVAAAHAGWRGLQAGVIENTIDALQEDPANCLLWLGPAIGVQAFEVGDEVRQAFVNEMPATAEAFVANKPGHWLADIYQLARIRLQQKGVNDIYGGGLCTYSDASRFYSYRRDGGSNIDTGRMASLIWRET
jgi:purine-nucleoside/S-methyl-5'-thioadenosine phosphorylase / adenosine deaminase